jgi:membrane protease YdiL (CAAX protease family)
MVPEPVPWPLPDHARRPTVWQAVGQLVLMLVVAVAAAVVGAILSDRLRLDDPRWEGVITTAVIALACTLAALVMVGASRQTPAALGLHARGLGLEALIGFLAMLAMYAMIVCASLAIMVLKPEWMNQSTAAQEAIERNLPPLSLRSMLGMMACVAAWEEVVFRGFLLTRLHAILKRWWLAVPVGASVFAAGHVYEGPLAVVVIGLVGVVLGGLFAWRKSLVGPIVFHFFFNVVGMLAIKSRGPVS